MSRRTRLKACHQSKARGLGHHINYALTSTYFPESYSILGNPIIISKRKNSIPIEENNKINYKYKVN
jgi:hypothetical protein